MTASTIIFTYLALLLFLGTFAGRLLKRSSGDYYLASRGIGPFMLLMSIFGTTMTSFALVGSTGKTFNLGIGVYGLMASWSGIVHAGVFFLAGAKIWALGKKHGYVTQISFFRDRYQSDALALLLFPVIVGFVLIYVLIGVVGGGAFLTGITAETFAEKDSIATVTLAENATVTIPEGLEDRLSYDATTRTLKFVGSAHPRHESAVAAANPTLAATSEGDPEGTESPIRGLFAQVPSGSIPYAASMAILCLVVLFYVFFGGMRATAWANTFQTLVFMVMGVIAFLVIKNGLGGAAAATQAVLDDPEAKKLAVREGLISHWKFASYALVPLSVGMFPHLFQHWLTARSASSFKLTVIAHPICILITWLPCVLLGMWAGAVLPASTPENQILVQMISRYSGEVFSGLIGAGVLAAIMSSMDSQFLCLSSLFANDLFARYSGKSLSDSKQILLGRALVLIIVFTCYLIGLTEPKSVFKLGVWCFSGFSGLVPLLFASLYWRGTTKAGAIASVAAVAGVWLYHFFSGSPVAPPEQTVGAGAAALFLVSWVTPKLSPEHLEKFFPAPKEA